MDEMKSKITALAKLDMTPGEIMAEKRIEFEREAAKREKWNKSWWRWFASWRLKALDMDGLTSAGMISISIVINCLEIIFFVLAVTTEYLYTIGVICIVVMGMIMGATLVETKQEGFAAFRNVLRNLVLPILPFLRIVDLIILLAEKRNPGCYNKRPIAELHVLTDMSTEIVEHYYIRRIEEAREELLGDASELRVTERDLFQRRERIQRQTQQLAARIGHAKDDLDRKALLKQVHEALVKRQDRIGVAWAQVGETVAKTYAILDECKAKVTKLRGPLGDAILLAEIERGSEGDDDAIANAHQAVDAHVEHVRAKLLQLATAVTSPTFARPSAEQEEGLEAYFARVERVAEKVNAI